jgi:hypothetical protein
MHMHVSTFMCTLPYLQQRIAAKLACHPCCLHQVLCCAMLCSAGHDRSGRYVLHAVNRVAEIFLSYNNGTLMPNALGDTRISLQAIMGVANVAAASGLVASEPVSSWQLTHLCGVCGLGMELLLCETASSKAATGHYMPQTSCPRLPWSASATLSKVAL